MKSWGCEEICLEEILAVCKLWVFVFKISCFSLPVCYINVVDVTFTAADTWQ